MESPVASTLPLPPTDCAIVRIVRGVPERARRDLSLLFMEKDLTAGARPHTDGVAP